MYNIVLKITQLIYAQRPYGYFDAQNSSTKFKDNPVAKAVQEQKVAIDHSSLKWQISSVTGVTNVTENVCWETRMYDLFEQNLYIFMWIYIYIHIC